MQFFWHHGRRHLAAADFRWIITEQGSSRPLIDMEIEMNACENHDVPVERNGADHDNISLELFRGQPEMERILRRAMKLFLPNQKES
jgi:hypothetical protein